MTYYATFESPLGEMLLTATGEGLSGAYFDGQKYFPARNGAAHESSANVNATTDPHDPKTNAKQSPPLKGDSGGCPSPLKGDSGGCPSPLKGDSGGCLSPLKGDSGGCDFSNPAESHSIPNPIETYFAAAKRQFEEYFKNRRKQFDLTLHPTGTPFQRRVWDALLTIPFGETTTYGALAATLGNPNAARAVAAAIGRNPISIIVPCHRVIGANGSLTGYAAGLDRKRSLMELEGVLERDLLAGDQM